MDGDTLRAIATYLTGALILVGAFFIIIDPNQTPEQKTQAWLMVGLVAGYFFRDAGQAAATRTVERMAAVQPTVTATSGPPATTTVTPAPTGDTRP